MIARVKWALSSYEKDLNSFVIQIRLNPFKNPDTYFLNCYKNGPTVNKRWSSFEKTGKKMLPSSKDIIRLDCLAFILGFSISKSVMKLKNGLHACEIEFRRVTPVTETV